jgi:hypothetical protein
VRSLGSRTLSGCHLRLFEIPRSGPAIEGGSDQGVQPILSSSDGFLWACYLEPWLLWWPLVELSPAPWFVPTIFQPAAREAASHACSEILRSSVYRVTSSKSTLEEEVAATPMARVERTWRSTTAIPSILATRLRQSLRVRTRASEPSASPKLSSWPA